MNSLDLFKNNRVPKRYTLTLFESANTAVIIKGRVNEEQCIAVDDSDRSRNIGGNRNARRTTFHDASSIDITSGLKQGLTRCIGTDRPTLLAEHRQR